MPFGQPVRYPNERRPCGCVVAKYAENAEQVTSYCVRHWKDLPAERRAQFRRLQRKGFIDGAISVLLRIAFLAVLAYMGWTVYGVLRNAL